MLSVSLPRHSLAVDFEEEINRLCNLPEDKIDIAIVSLTLAKELYPDLDIENYSAKVDEMVQGAKTLTKGSTDPDYRVRALNTYLFKRRGIEYDLSDPNVQKAENRHLNGIFDTKKGSCITMPLLYLAVAQRLGYPVYPVALPWHVILRYVDPAFKQQNIEATGGGGYVSDDEYTHVFQISKRSIEAGAYLRTMTYREFLGDLITYNAVYWGKQGNHPRAIRYLKKAVELNPRSADTFKLLGISYELYGKTYPYLMPNDRVVAIQMVKQYFDKANELGVTTVSNSNYLPEQKRAQQEYRSKHKE